jgi:hypothetical protein
MECVYMHHSEKLLEGLWRGKTQEEILVKCLKFKTKFFALGFYSGEMILMPIFYATEINSARKYHKNKLNSGQANL